MPDEAKWDYSVKTNSKPIFLEHNVFKGARMYIRLNCDREIPDSKLTVTLIILQSPCWLPDDTFLELDNIISNKPSKVPKVLHTVQEHSCNGDIFIDDLTISNRTTGEGMHPSYEFKRDGVYVFGLGLTTNGSSFIINAHLEIKSDYGYLSAVDWPLLPFYGGMCVYYIILGLVWLVVSFLQWRDLLRVQFWIAGVILLGMLEKATFYAEYHSINNTGIRIQGAIIFAEWVSCAKRTLARMLVIVISLGFGIVKPRLGSTLHRVVGVGVLYFLLAASESYLRITKVKYRDDLIATVPLAVLDSAICWWIFSALFATRRTLRLRTNETKLSLYRHFTNTLIFSVIASIIFMVYCFKVHRFTACLTVWKNIWLETAFWHILFSCILLIIMILWRPTNNNQRYAFVPLLDTGDENDEEEQLVSDAYGVKVRMHKQTSRSPRNSEDDDLKWLEENIKTDPTLPILDSDEELVNTRFELSKMQ